MINRCDLIKCNGAEPNDSYTSDNHPTALLDPASQSLKDSLHHLHEQVIGLRKELDEKNAQLLCETYLRKKAEEKRVIAETQLDRFMSIATFDKSAGAIVHDLNNFLSPVIINLEELIASESPTSHRCTIVNEALQAAYCQRDIIRQINSLNRQDDQTYMPLRLMPLLEETIAFMHTAFPITIELRLRMEAASDIIKGNPVQIKRVIMNLCQNASDALCGKEGTIELSLMNTNHVPLCVNRDRQPGDYIRLSVRDNGHGMSKEIMDKIFEPFFTTKDAGHGTGIGLSIVQSIVKSHGGAITVESKEGKGSLFTLYLPACNNDQLSLRFS